MSVGVMKELKVKTEWSKKKYFLRNIFSVWNISSLVVYNNTWVHPFSFFTPLVAPSLVLFPSVIWLNVREWKTTKSPPDCQCKFVQRIIGFSYRKTTICHLRQSFHCIRSYSIIRCQNPSKMYHSVVWNTLYKTIPSSLLLHPPCWYLWSVSSHPLLSLFQFKIWKLCGPRYVGKP